QHSGPLLIVVLVAEHVRQETARLRTPTLACPARLQFAQLPRLILASARLVCGVVHAQLVIGLTRAPEWHQAVRDRLCLLADQAYPQDRVPRLPPGLCPDPVAGCLPHAQQRESAAEYSLDFRL